MTTRCTVRWVNLGDDRKGRRASVIDCRTSACSHTRTGAIHQLDIHIVMLSSMHHRVSFKDTSSCYHHLVISSGTSPCYHHLVSSTDTSTCYHHAIRVIMISSCYHHDIINLVTRAARGAEARSAGGGGPCIEQKIAQFRTHYLTKELAYVSTQQSGQLDTFLLNHFSVHCILA